MKILFGSDFHGLAKAYQSFVDNLNQDSYDIGIISGDLMTYSYNKFEHEKTLVKILNKTNKKILVIMGNDDGLLEEEFYNPEWKSNKNVVNINNKFYTYKGIKFFGYQYSLPTVGGRFEKTEEEQSRELENVSLSPKTIFVSHSPPYKILDKIENKNFGSKAILEFVKRNNENILYHLFGHVHQNFGIRDKYINGSFPNTFKFIEINTETKKCSFISV